MFEGGAIGFPATTYYKGKIKMEDFKNENEIKNPIEQILDPNCDDDIILYDEDNNETVFGQAAVIPLRDEIYVILVPVTKIDGVGEDEGIVFVIEEDEDEEPILSVVTDDKIVDEVFEEYFKLEEEEG